MTEERKRKSANTTLTLKRRQATGDIFPVSSRRLLAAIRQGKDALWNYFAPLQNGSYEVHDKVWLEMVINATPQGGLPLTKMVPWLKLAERVGEVEEQDGESFGLHKKEVDLLWDRMLSDDFSLNQPNSALWGFLQDFMAATDKELPETE